MFRYTASAGDPRGRDAADVHLLQPAPGLRRLRHLLQPGPGVRGHVCGVVGPAGRTTCHEPLQGHVDSVLGKNTELLRWLALRYNQVTK